MPVPIAIIVNPVTTPLSGFDNFFEPPPQSPLRDPGPDRNFRRIPHREPPMRYTPPAPSLEQLREHYFRSELTWQRGLRLVETDRCTLRHRDGLQFEFDVEDRFDDFTVHLSLNNDTVSHTCSCRSLRTCCHHAAAALIATVERLADESRPSGNAGSAYTREEMIARVLREREERARRERFELLTAENIYGIHHVRTAAGRTYEITLRDFQSGSGYCSCPDFRTNRLGTCKHLMFARREIHDTLPVDRLLELQSYPFVEIYCDPLHDYRITYFYKGKLTVDIATLLEKYFQGKTWLEPERYPEFVHFLKKAGDIRKILVRPEVGEAVDRYFEDELMAKLAESVTPDFETLHAPLADYQKDGVRFALFQRGAILADEAGLDARSQAVAVAALKRDLFGLRRVLIVSPAARKGLWAETVQRLTGTPAALVEGGKDQREAIYAQSDAYVLIANYETVVTDEAALRGHPPDMIVLDEAQRIKDYAARISMAVKAIPKSHALALTPLPLLERLGDLYAIMTFIDPRVLAPLWEFSLRHCYFERDGDGRITGYHHLDALADRMAPWLLRRTRAEVADQLAPVVPLTLPVVLGREQREHHETLRGQLAELLDRKHATVFDLQRLESLLTGLRQVSTAMDLIDPDRRDAPKLDELEALLLDTLDLAHRNTRVAVFSEWEGLRRIVGRLVDGAGLAALDAGSESVSGFLTEPTGKVWIAGRMDQLPLADLDAVIWMELPWERGEREARLTATRKGRDGAPLLSIQLLTMGGIEERLAGGIAPPMDMLRTLAAEDAHRTPLDLSDDRFRPLLSALAALARPYPHIDIDEVRETLAPPPPAGPAEQLPLFDDQAWLVSPRRRSRPRRTAPARPARGALDPPRLEKTLQRGMDFMTGLLEMATGSELNDDQRRISIDPETGEVVMRFRLPTERPDADDGEKP